MILLNINDSHVVQSDESENTPVVIYYSNLFNQNTLEEPPPFVTVSESIEKFILQELKKL